MKKILVMLALTMTSLAQAENVKMVVGEAFPPLMWNDNGTPKGVAVELGKAILTKAGFTVTVEPCPWLRCQMAAEKEGAFIVGFSQNEERLKKFVYSDVTMYDNVVLVTKKGKEFPFTKNEDLKGKTLGAQLGASFGQRFEDIKKLANYDKDDGDVQRMKKIVAGNIDAGAFSLGQAGVNYSAKLAGVDAATLSVLPEAIAKDPNYIATGMTTAGAKEKIAKINEAIKALQADGTIDKITKMTF